MAKLNGNFGVSLGMNEIDNPLPRGFMFGAIKSGTAGCDAALGRHAGHLGKDQPCPSFGALGIVDQMPVSWRAVDRTILRHRRDNDAVLQFDAPHTERHEHRRPRHLRRAPGGLAFEPALRIAKPDPVTLTQVLMADALRARQQRIVELNRIEIEVPLDILEPFSRIARRTLQTQHLEPPLILVAAEGLGHRRLAVQIIGQRNGAFERKF